MKQTAVEWLIDQIINNNGVNQKTFEQAKQMEKKQISESWNNGNFLGRNGSIYPGYHNGDSYYDKTYNSEVTK